MCSLWCRPFALLTVPAEVSLHLPVRRGSTVPAGLRIQRLLWGKSNTLVDKDVCSWVCFSVFNLWDKKHICLIKVFILSVITKLHTIFLHLRVDSTSPSCHMYHVRKSLFSGILRLQIFCFYPNIVGGSTIHFSDLVSLVYLTKRWEQKSQVKLCILLRT